MTIIMIKRLLLRILDMRERFRMKGVQDRKPDHWQEQILVQDQKFLKQGWDHDQNPGKPIIQIICIM